nr:WD-40 repeat-containing protein MSI4-like [Tanacetum cinerariifolium]
MEHKALVNCVQWCPDKSSVFGSSAEDGQSHDAESDYTESDDDDDDDAESGYTESDDDDAEPDDPEYDDDQTTTGKEIVVEEHKEESFLIISAYKFYLDVVSFNVFSDEVVFRINVLASSVKDWILH